MSLSPASPGGAFLTRERRLYAAWIVAVVATLGSLYFSEVARFLPCALCWYQRICMYPLAFILGVAAYRNDLAARAYAVPLAVVGWGVALYHVLEEHGVVKTLASCVVGVPCTTKWINWFGFVTIPTLSLVGFTLILAFLAWRRR